MKFTSLLATLSLAASAFAVYITSADGTQIWAEATGNPKKPAVVFIPGFSCTSLAFDKQWYNSFMTSSLYMVHESLNGCIQRHHPSHSILNRFGMMFVVRASAANLSAMHPTNLRTLPTTSKP
jgi:hypothetical protein